MVQLGYLASTLLMGAFLVAVVAFLRLAEYREYSMSLTGDESGPVAVLRGLAGSTTAWIAVFLVAVVVATLASVAAVGGLVPADSGAVAIAGGILAAIIGIFVGGYLVWGAYYTARARGYHSAAAVMVSAWVVGLALVGAIMAVLLTG